MAVVGEFRASNAIEEKRREERREREIESCVCLCNGSDEEEESCVRSERGGCTSGLKVGGRE